jgi:hypothetical protein
VRLRFTSPPSESSPDTATMRALMRLGSGLRRPESYWLRRCWSRSGGLRPTAHLPADASLGQPNDSGGRDGYGALVNSGLDDSLRARAEELEDESPAEVLSGLGSALRAVDSPMVAQLAREQAARWSDHLHHDPQWAV